MSWIVTVALVIAAIVHILPLSGVLGAGQLNTLLGVALDDPNLLILMRHRAILFAILGGILLLAAFKPQLQPLTILVGLISTIAFLWLAWSTGEYNANIARVVTSDIIAIVCLIVAGGVLASG